jgi:hypothetical protein
VEETPALRKRRLWSAKTGCQASRLQFKYSGDVLKHPHAYRA